MGRESDSEENEKAKEASLSRKERAKKIRQEAYQRAKEYKKNDPREIERKERAKAQRKAAYQKAKEQKKAASGKARPDLMDKVVRAIDLVEDDRPLAPVIALDSYKSKKKRKSRRPVS